MGKTIIIGVAALLLSAGVAVAQSNSGQGGGMSAGTSAKADTQSNSPSDAASEAKPARKVHMASRYPKAEARLNREEAQETKELNEQESQQVASNGSTKQQ
ncbi:MAG TPA: hypothetical protein VMU31_00455 [Rhizomicrobium sp.]|nr:hypothetical protein [Rhizomicrobium sp.]